MAGSRETLCENCGRRIPIRRDGRLAKHKMYTQATARRGWARKQATGWKNPECAASESVAVIL